MYFLNTLPQTKNNNTHRIKVRYHLVKEAQTLQPLVVDRFLRVEIGEIGHASKQDAHRRVTLGVQFVVGSFPVAHKVLGHVHRKHIVHQGLITSAHVTGPLLLVADLGFPHENYPVHLVDLKGIQWKCGFR